MPASTSPPPSGLVPRAVIPLAALLVGYPLWWLLGIQMVMWAFLGLVVAVWCYTNRDTLEMPPGFGWFAAFLGWVLISALTLTSAKYAMAYSFRLVLYASVILIGLQVFNVVHQRLVAPQQILRMLVCIWGFAVVLAVPGLVAGTTLQFNSPLGTVLERVGISDAFIRALTTVTFSSVDSLYGLSRPSPLFEFTNAWGAAIGVLTPLAVYVMVSTSSLRERWLIGSILVLSIWPIVVSLNRGCWLSIAIAGAYVVGRRMSAGDWRTAGASLMAVVALGLIIVTTPLLSVINERVATANTDTRANLYVAALEYASRSPFFGYGAPQSSELVANNNGVSVGTHGQFWTLLVSHGWVGVTLFVLGVVSMSWIYRPTSGRSAEVWLHSTGIVLLFQMFVYDVVPVPMLVFLCSHAAIAEQRRSHRNRTTHLTVGQKGNSIVRLL